MRYQIEVTLTVTVEIEADSEHEALDEACFNEPREIGWGDHGEVPVVGCPSYEIVTPAPSQ